MRKLSHFIIVVIIVFCMISCDSDSNGSSRPTVSSTSPSSGATGVDVSDSISITFSTQMDQTSSEAAFSISPQVNGAFEWSGNTMTFNPTGNLSYSTEYTVSIDSGAASSEGMEMNSDYSFVFTTESKDGDDAREFPRTENGIYIFSDQFSSNLSEAQWQFAAQNYVGCQKMTLSSVRKLRSYNSNFIVLHYRLAHGAGNHQIIKGNSWVYYWDDVNPHENWFVHMVRGDYSSGRVHNADWDWYYTDPSGDIEGAGDDGWKEYFVSATIEEMRATECDGVFADSCGLPFSLTQWPDWLWGTNPRTTWLPHVNTFMQYVMNRYKREAESFYFIPNAAALVTSWDDVTDFSIADGVMCEGFSEWGGGPLQGGYSDWALQMNSTLSLTVKNKVIIMQTYPDANDIRARMFALGCYLLVKGKYSYINMPAGGETELFWWPEYGIDLGGYSEDPPANINSLQTADGIYRRDYQRGFVLVNPTGSTVTLSLGATYRRAVPSGGGYVPTNGAKPGSLSYQSVTSVTLAPGEAAILLQ
jgi:hypothetical protein